MGRNSRLLAVAVALVAAVAAGWLVPGLFPSPADPRAPEKATSAVAAPPTPPSSAPSTPSSPAAARRGGRGVLAGRLVRWHPYGPLRGRVQVDGTDGAAATCAVEQDGFFRVEGLPAGVPLALTARSEGLLPARFSPVRVPEEGVFDLGDVSLGPAIPVEVVVRDPADGPVAGASVTLHRTAEDAGRTPDRWGFRAAAVDAPPPPDPEFRATTDAGGSARFAESSPGFWLVRAAAPGFVTGEEVVPLTEGHLREPVTVRLRSACSLSATLRFADGSAAAGLRVAALCKWRRFLPTQAPVPRAATVSGADGGFRLEGLERGNTEIWVERAPASWYCVAAPILPLTGSLDIRIPGVSLFEGRVVDAASGEPLGGAEATLSRAGSHGGDSGPSAIRGRAWTDPDGRFRLELLPEEGRLTLSVRRDTHLPEEVSFEAGEPEKVREVRLSRGGVLRGRVLRVDGAAVPGAVVWARPVRPGVSTHFRPEDLGEETRRVRSGPDGSYRIEPAPTGKVLVAAMATGLVLPDLPLDMEWGYGPDELPDSLKVDVPWDGTEAVRDLTLHEGASVEGKVVDAEGKPVQGYAVRVGTWPRLDSHQNQERVPDGEGLGGPTGADGSFRVTGLLPCTRRFVYAWGPGPIEGWSRTFDLAERESVKDLVVKLGRNRATLAGTVRYDDGTPAAGAGVGTSAWEGVNLEAGWIDEADIIPVDAAGNFRGERVRPGEYTVFAVARDSVGSVGPRIKIAAGETKDGLAFVLTRALRVAGRVLGTDGSPVLGAVVRVDPVGEDEEAPPEEHEFYSSPGGAGPRVPVLQLSTATADAEGRFLQERLAPGEYWVTAGAPGHTEAWTRARAGGDAVEIRLPRALAISGRVVDAETGAPAARVPIWLRAPEGAGLPSGIGWLYSGTDGTFRLPDLVPGEYEIQFASHLNEPALEYEETTVEAVAAGTSDLVVRLRRGLTLAGKVVDQTGSPVPDLGIRLDDDGGEEPHFRSSFSLAFTRTGKDGGFRFGGLASANYRLTAAGEDLPGRAGRSDREVVSTTVRGLVPGGAEVVFRVERGLPIKGRIVDAEGRPARPSPSGGSGRVVYAPSGGEPTESGRETVVWAMESGAFETPPLPPGRTYDLFARGFADTTKGELRGVKPGSSVVIRLAAGSFLAGTILDEAGMPVPADVPVELLNEEGGYESSGRTTEGGKFRFTGLEEGEYRVSGGGGDSDFIEGALKEAYPAGTTGVSLTLKRGVTISGLLLDSKGKPVRHPRVRVHREGYHGHGSEDGTFQLRGLTPGKKRLLTTEGGRGFEIDLGVFEAPTSGLVLTLPADPRPFEEPEDDAADAPPPAPAPEEKDER